MRIALLVRATTVAIASMLAGTAVAPAAEPKYRLTLETERGGTIRSADGELRCPSHCSRRYRGGRLVMLKAAAATDFEFERWSAGCVGTGPTCIVAMERARTVRAEFSRRSTYLGLLVTGAGVVTSTPAGILCSPLRKGFCLATMAQGEAVRLVAAAAPGHTLAGWGGACAGRSTPICDLVLGPANQNRVTATFRSTEPALGPQTLTVVSTGVRIVSFPPGIDCPGTCSASYPGGTLVTLSGPPATSWSGACTGINEPCTLAVDGPTTVVVGTVLGQTSGLGINVSVSGPGRVEGKGGIRCGYKSGRKRDCQSFFRQGEVVVLRAVPAKKAKFLRWGSFCSGRQRTCPVRVTAAKSVVAVFGRR